MRCLAPPFVSLFYCVFQFLCYIYLDLGCYIVKFLPLYNFIKFLIYIEVVRNNYDCKLCILELYCCVVHSWVEIGSNILFGA